jgi:hypothetical protein
LKRTPTKSISWCKSNFKKSVTVRQINPKLDLFMTLALSVGLNNQISVFEIYSKRGKVIKREKVHFWV